MKNFLTAQEVIVLKEAHLDTRLRKQADRIKSILLLNEGYNYSEIARILMLDETTIRRYQKEYQRSGLDGLLENNYSGSESFLTIEQQSELILHLKQHTCRTVKEAIFYVQAQYEVNYSTEGLTQLLHKLGFVYKKTKQVPSKFDPVKQAEFIQQYRLLKDTKKLHDNIYFLDGTHPQHNNMPFYGWIYKGETKTIKANTGRERLNLNGALNLDSLDITVINELTINSEAMIRLLTVLEAKQPQGVIYAIADNARYNHSKKIAIFLKSHRRIKLIYLPPYSPNLNIIERLWLFFHRKQLQNHYYQTFKEFKTAVLDFFDNINIYKPELRTLLTDSFQTLPY